LIAAPQSAASGGPSLNWNRLERNTDGHIALKEFAAGDKEIGGAIARP
jgi:hypothetical protein